MFVRAPLVEAEQDGSIRIQDLTKVIVTRKRLRLAEERLVPLEATGNIAHADDRPSAFHRSSPVGAWSTRSSQLRATSAAATRWPVVFSTVAKTSGIASTAIRIPIPLAGRPMARKSGVSMMNAPRGIPGAAKARNTAAKAIVATLAAWSGTP